MRKSLGYLLLGVVILCPCVFGQISGAGYNRNQKQQQDQSQGKMWVNVRINCKWVNGRITNSARVTVLRNNANGNVLNAASVIVNHCRLVYNPGLRLFVGLIGVLRREAKVPVLITCKDMMDVQGWVQVGPFVRITMPSPGGTVFFRQTSRGTTEPVREAFVRWIFSDNRNRQVVFKLMRGNRDLYSVSTSALSFPSKFKRQIDENSLTRLLNELIGDNPGMGAKLAGRLSAWVIPETTRSFSFSGAAPSVQGSFSTSAMVNMRASGR